MTTPNLTYPQQSTSKLPLILVGVLILMAGLMAASLNLHMLEGDHPEESIEVVDMINCSGYETMMIRPEDGRHAQICQLDDGKWGAYIEEADEDPVTAYKTKYKTIDKIMKYLGRQGYIEP